MLKISLQFFGGRGGGGSGGARGGRAGGGGGASEGERTYNEAVQYGMSPRGTIEDIRAVETMNVDNAKYAVKESAPKGRWMKTETKAYETVTIKTPTKGYASVDMYKTNGEYTADIRLGGKLITIVSGNTQAEALKAGKRALVNYISGYRA